MYFQNLLATTNIRQSNNHLAVKSAWTQQRWVQHVWAVCSCHDDYAIVNFKTIHFYQQLVQGLLALIVSTAQAGTTVATDCIDFIDEDNTGRLLLGLVEHVPHSGRADTNKHFNKVGA